LVRQQAMPACAWRLGVVRRPAMDDTPGIPRRRPCVRLPPATHMADQPNRPKQDKCENPQPETPAIAARPAVWQSSQVRFRRRHPPTSTPNCGVSVPHSVSAGQIEFAGPPSVGVVPPSLVQESIRLPKREISVIMLHEFAFDVRTCVTACSWS